MHTHKNVLLLLQSSRFDCALSLACDDSLHVGLFAVKRRHFLLVYCHRQEEI